MNLVEIELCGEPVRLLAQRAAHLPDRGDLLVADLHFGKTESFRRHGIPIPQGQTREDLERLDQLIEFTRPRRLVLLGDFTHAKLPQETDTYREMQRSLEATRVKNDVEVLLVRGNHDEHEAELAARMDIPSVEEERAGPFHYVHDPDIEGSELHQIGGHLHPGIELRGGGDRMFLPAFWVRANSMVLPSFGGFTGKWAIKPRVRDRVFAVGPDQVIEV